MDIKGAIGAEREYIKSGSGNIYEYLSLYGYNDLEKFFADKKEYLFNNIEFEYFDGSIDNIVNVIDQYINGDTPAVLIPHADKTFVWTGEKDFNEQYCLEHNIPVKRLGYNGGTIVTGEDDFSIMIIFPSSIDVNMDYLLGKFCEILGGSQKGFSIDENDILLNGDKVAGCVFFDKNGFYIFAMELSLTDHSGDIKNICVKPADKTPSYVKGVTNTQIRQAVTDWLRL